MFWLIFHQWVEYYTNVGKIQEVAQNEKDKFFGLEMIITTKKKSMFTHPILN